VPPDTLRVQVPACIDQFIETSPYAHTDRSLTIPTPDGHSPIAPPLYKSFGICATRTPTLRKNVCALARNCPPVRPASCCPQPCAFERPTCARPHGGLRGPVPPWVRFVPDVCFKWSDLLADAIFTHAHIAHLGGVLWLFASLIAFVCQNFCS